jgi:hypothetical protein
MKRAELFHPRIFSDQQWAEEYYKRNAKSIERITKKQGRIMITDLRRIWLGLVVKKLKTAYTLEEGKKVISKSDIRPGRYTKGPFWLDYMAGL